ncbi:MAG: hypothetical protein AAF441_05945 [Pseudomonadota bacterium]
MQAEHEKTLAALILALCVIAALFFPEVSHSLAPFLLHSLFFVMVFSLLPFARLDGQELTKPHPIVLALVAWQQFALPALTLLFGYVFGIDQQWLFFLLLTVTSGSLFASPTLVQLMGLEQKMAVQTVVLSTLAAPVSIYLTFSLLMGGHLDLDMGLFAFRLVIFLAVPIAIFCVVKVAIREWEESSKDKLDGIGRWGSVLALVVFCFALEDNVTYAIQDDPNKVFEYLMVAIVATIVIGVLTRIVMAKFGARAAMTATILCSFRNVGLTFGLVGQFAGPELAVYVGACQIPMFFSPLLFELFIGKSRHLPIDQEYPETELNPGEPASSGSTPPVAHPAGRGATAAVNTQPVYQTAGNAALAVQPAMASLREVQAQAASAQVVNLHQGVQPALDLQREDARALVARIQDALHEASHRLKEHEAKEKNRSAGYYVAAFMVVAAAGLATVWQANKYFFPMLFDDKLIERVAQAHTNGQNFGVHDLNINIRDLRDATIARMPHTPKTVVLGASHWQEAHVNLLPNNDFYNSHVHRDYYEDMMAVTEMWLRHGKLPEEMIITIRDNLLTPIPDRTDFLWLPGIKYYRDFAQRIGFKPHSWWETLPVQTWRELLSLPLLYTQAETVLAAPLEPHATDKRFFETLDVLLPGGSIIWSGDHKRFFSQERARKEALDFAAYKRKNPPKIDPKGVAHLEALFQFLKDKGVKVTLAHPQFNPIFWDAVQGSPYIDGLEKVKQLTRQWSKKYGFPLMGGFAPEDVGCTADMYIDAEHGNPTCLGMLLNQYPYKNKPPVLRGGQTG